IGKMLREAREARGLSLREISETTKIQIRYLKALEENNFSVFPGEVYARGAIRNYAEAVGLDSAELLAMHRELSKEEDTVETAKETASVPGKEAAAGISNKNKWIKVLAALLSILLIATVFYFFFNKGKGSPEQGNNNNINEKQVDENPQDENGDENPEDEQNQDEQENEIPDEPAVEVTLAESSSKSEKYQVKNADNIILNINFSSKCWVRVKEGELKLISKNYKAGEVCLVENEKELEVRLGNPAGISELKVNDVIIPVRKQTSPYNIIITPVK
ncbi:MAG TPA: helix-turn-helix domain-containing protein, partial [Firmicutes bacterium]|nr:helix-turn-helix domain-containing protein [Bacillota bacterium]